MLYENVNATGIKGYASLFEDYAALTRGCNSQSQIEELVSNLLQKGNNRKKLLFGLEKEAIAKIEHLSLKPLESEAPFDASVDISFKLNGQDDYLQPWLNLIFQENEIFVTGGPDRYSVIVLEDDCPSNSYLILAPSEAMIGLLNMSQTSEFEFILPSLKYERKTKETICYDQFEVPEDIRVGAIPLTELHAFLQYAEKIPLDEIKENYSSDQNRHNLRIPAKLKSECADELLETCDDSITIIVESINLD